MQAGNFLVNSASTGIPDIFISKTDDNGNILWLTRAGGTGSDRPYSICSDASGNVYITGSYYGSATFGSTFLSSSGGTQDVFIAKLDAAGNFVWAKSAGGGQNDIGNAICTDNQGNVYVTGQFQALATFGASSLTSVLNPQTGAYSFDVFIAKYDVSGNFQWVRQGAASLNDRGLGIGCDNGGNVYVCGQFSDTITFQNTYNNQIQNAVFIVKYNAAGQEQWFRKAGATYSIANDLVTDNSNNIYITGDCQGNMCFYGPPNSYLNNPNTYQAYIAKYSAAGSLTWAKCDGSVNEVTSRCIALDHNQDPYMLGEFRCRFTDYSTAFGPSAFMSVGFKDLFVAKYSAAGIRQWFRHAGGHQNDLAHGLLLLEDDEPVMAGSYGDDINFPIGSFPVIGNNINSNLSCVASGNCGDPTYGVFYGYQGAGYVDGFLSKLLNPQRQPYDFYERQAGGCYRDTLLGCISDWNQQCPDTIRLCDEGDISIEQFQCYQLGPHYEYSWNGGPFTLYNTIFHVNTSGYYSVKLKSEDGCTGDEDTVYVKINISPPDPLVSDDYVVNTSAVHPLDIVGCYPDSAWLWITNPVPTYSVSWQDPTGMVVQGDSIKADIAGSYAVLFVDANGCSDTNSLLLNLITVPPPIKPFTNMPDSFVICSGNDIDYYVYDSITNPTGIFPTPNCLNYGVWWQSNPVSFISALEGNCGLGGKFHPVATGNYTISASYTYNNNCGSDTVFFSRPIYVKVNPLPSITVTQQGSPYVCPGDSVLLTYSVSVANCSSCTTAISGPLSAWFHSGSHSFSASATDTLTGCSNIDGGSYQVSDKLPPYIVPSPLDEIICPNDSVNLTCINPWPYTIASYEWYGPNGQLSDHTATIYKSVPGVYYCVITDADSCRLTTNMLEIKQYNTPYLEALPGNTICSGQSAQLHVVANDSTLIQWQPPLSGGGTVRYVTSAGTYSCEVTMCGITTTCSIVVSVSNPSVSVSAIGSSTICPGDSVILHGSPGPYNYQWLPGNQVTEDITVFAPGAYTLNITDAMGCTASSAPVSIYFNTSVAMPTGINDTVCLGQSAVISASSTYVINWYTSLYGGGAVHTGSTLTLNSLTADTLFYIAAYDASLNCHSVRVPVRAIVSAYSYAPLVSGDTLLCAGDSASIIASGFPAGASVHWTGPGLFTSQQDTVSFYPVATSQSGVYSVITSGHGCSSAAVSHTLSVRNVRVSLGNDTTLCNGSQLLLQAGNYPVILWQDSSHAPARTISQPGTYAVYVSDGVACFDADTIEVLYTACDDTIPNVFTPNGDGANDIFTVKIAKGHEFKMYIYDRWGLLMATLDNLHASWDGRNKDSHKLVSCSTYFYILETRNLVTDETKTRRGFITVQY